MTPPSWLLEGPRSPAPAAPAAIFVAGGRPRLPARSLGYCGPAWRLSVKTVRLKEPSRRRRGSGSDMPQAAVVLATGRERAGALETWRGAGAKRGAVPVRSGEKRCGQGTVFRIARMKEQLVPCTTRSDNSSGFVVPGVTRQFSQILPISSLPKSHFATLPADRSRV